MSMNKGLKALYSNIINGKLDTNVEAGLENFRITTDGNFGSKDSKSEESYLSSYRDFVQNLNTVIAVNAENVAPGTEGVEVKLTSTQIKAGYLGGQFGHLGGIHAAGGVKAVNGIDTIQLRGQEGSSKLPTVGLESVDVIGSGDLNLAELGFGTESFDPTLNMNAQHIATFINIGLAKQEDFAEMFFPTVMIDPMETGIKALVKYSSFVTEYRRDIKDPKNPMDKMNPKPLIKNLYNREVLGEDQIKLVPVNRNEYRDLLNPTYKYTSTVTGQTFESAPYKFNKDVEVLRMSQTDADVARGVMDNTDTLSPSLTLSNIYFGFEGDQKAIQAFKVNVSRLPGANFGFIGQGHFKDLNLSFKRHISIRLGDLGTALWDGSKQALDNTKKNAINGKLNGAKLEEFVVTFEINLTGSANLQTGVVSVVSGEGYSISVSGVVDKDGNAIDTSAKGELGQLIVDAVSTNLTLLGYDLDAYATNTNLRKLGRTIQIDEYGQYFVCPWRTPFNVVGPLIRATGKECDFDHVNTLVTAIVAASDVHAIIELERFSDSLAIRANDPQSIADAHDYSFHGRLVNTFYKYKTMNLTEHVDSLMSKDRMDDIKAAMLIDIKLACLEMLVKSNYLLAFNVLYKGTGKKPIVLIGCNPILKEILTHGQDSDKITGNNFDIVIVSTLNPSLEDRMYITLTLGDSVGAVTNIEALNFGWRLFSTAITANVTPETSNGKVVTRSVIIPRYFHVADLPIMMVYDVKGLPEVMKKIHVLTK